MSLLYLMKKYIYNMHTRMKYTKIISVCPGQWVGGDFICFIYIKECIYIHNIYNKEKKWLRAPCCLQDQVQAP